MGLTLRMVEDKKLIIESDSLQAIDFLTSNTHTQQSSFDPRHCFLQKLFGGRLVERAIWLLLSWRNRVIAYLMLLLFLILFRIVSNRLTIQTELGLMLTLYI